MKPKVKTASILAGIILASGLSGAGITYAVNSQFTDYCYESAVVSKSFVERVYEPSVRDAITLVSLVPDAAEAGFESSLPKMSDVLGRYKQVEINVSTRSDESTKIENQLDEAINDCLDRYDS